eukprot:315317-Pyramimonas_sp.AAC.1
MWSSSFMISALGPSLWRGMMSEATSPARSSLRNQGAWYLFRAARAAAAVADVHCSSSGEAS